MKEIFYEETAKHRDVKSENIKFNIFNVLSYISFFVALFWFILGILSFEYTPDKIIFSIIFLVLPCAVFCFSGFIFAIFRNKNCVDYDYTFVSGSFSFAKVIHNSKRKEIISFDAANVEKIGVYQSKLSNKYENSENIKKLYLTSNDKPSEEKDFYYIVANVSGLKYYLLLECSHTFIANTRFFVKNFLYDEELK